MNPDTAFDQGYEAYMQNEEVWQCPYAQDSFEESSWKYGYYQAEQNHLENQDDW